MAYRDFGYTIVISAMHWHKCIILVLIETHLGGGIMSAFVFPSTTIAQAPCFDFRWQYSPQEMPIEILTTVPWLPPCTDAYMPTLTLVAKLWAL